MKRLACGGLLAITVALAGCGGTGEEDAAGPSRPQTAVETQARTGVPPCWRDVAETYRAASTTAFPIFDRHVPEMVEQYDGLVSADAGSDEAAFERAYDRLFNTMRRTAREAEAFLVVEAEARDALVACNLAPPGDESANPCWNKTALAHQVAVERARLTLRRHLQPIFEAFDRIFQAAARDDDVGVRAANRRLAAAFEAFTPGARRYAREQGTAEQVYVGCSGAA